MKRLKLFMLPMLMLALVLPVAFVMSACGGDTSPTDDRGDKFETGTFMAYAQLEFNMNGGTGMIPLQRFVASTDEDGRRIIGSETFVVPNSEPTRQYYVFAGWFTQATGGMELSFPIELEHEHSYWNGIFVDESGSPIQGESWTATVTAHAQWTPYHTLTLDAQNGAENTTLRVNPVTQAVTTPAEPARQFHNFNGWFTESTGGTAFNFANVTGDATVFAQWDVMPMNEILVGTWRVVQQTTAGIDIPVNLAMGGTMDLVFNADGTYTVTGVAPADEDMANLMPNGTAPMWAIWAFGTVAMGEVTATNWSYANGVITITRTHNNGFMNDTMTKTVSIDEQGRLVMADTENGIMVKYFEQIESGDLTIKAIATGDYDLHSLVIAEIVFDVDDFTFGVNPGNGRPTATLKSTAKITQLLGLLSTAELEYLDSLSSQAGSSDRLVILGIYIQMGFANHMAAIVIVDETTLIHPQGGELQFVLDESTIVVNFGGNSVPMGTYSNGTITIVNTDNPITRTFNHRV